VSWEVAANGGRDRYAAWRAHQRARALTRRPKPFKLVHGPLLAEVATGPARLWSPQQVAKRLRLEHPNHPEMHVSHETIHQSLYVRGAVSCGGSWPVA
jgi:IS30 family transposase